MTNLEKVKCKAIANNIKLGKWGEYTGSNFDAIIELVKEDYDLTNEMIDYIETLLTIN